MDYVLLQEMDLDDTPIVSPRRLQGSSVVTLAALFHYLAILSPLPKIHHVSSSCQLRAQVASFDDSFFYQNTNVMFKIICTLTKGKEIIPVRIICGMVLLPRPSWSNWVLSLWLFVYC